MALDRPGRIPTAAAAGPVAPPPMLTAGMNAVAVLLITRGTAGRRPTLLDPGRSSVERLLWLQE